jgi:site-specific DNA-methyltransferase (adenine-specific)
MEFNKIVCGDCLDVLKTYDDNTFDLTIFSPPYDNLRDYNGYEMNLHLLGMELFRVTKEGGIVVMVIQDQTNDGWKTLTSFKTIIDWCESVGFGLFECVIYKKQGKDGAWFTKRFRVDHEYIPIFVKGRRPKFFNKEHIKIPSKHGGKTMTGGANREKDGTTKKSVKLTINPLKCPGTIWDYANGGDKNKIKRLHPATFPDKIPFDFIRVFTEENDLILDPMCGSGSSCVAAKILNRKYVGIDISQEYCDISTKRIDGLETSLIKVD